MDKLTKPEEPPPPRLRFKTGEFVSDVESDETPRILEDPHN